MLPSWATVAATPAVEAIETHQPAGALGGVVSQRHRPQRPLRHTDSERGVSVVVVAATPAAEAIETEHKTRWPR